MAVVSMKELLEAGVHFGHQTRRWNPKMRRFIYTERGGTVLFVGTKKQAQDAVEEQAKRVGMPYVNHRWLGGLLTNWRTISDRIGALHDIRRLKTDGQLDLLPAKERIQLGSELEKL